MPENTSQLVIVLSRFSHCIIQALTPSIIHANIGCALHAGRHFVQAASSSKPPLGASPHQSGGSLSGKPPSFPATPPLQPAAPPAASHGISTQIQGRLVANHPLQVTCIALQEQYFLAARSLLHNASAAICGQTLSTAALCKTVF